MERFDTVVIGAGQAGLVTSYHLREQGREHVLLEANAVAHRWRDHRWDSFTLVTPNWAVKLPGFPLDADPEGFLTRDEIVAFLEAYAEHIDAPIRTGVRVESVEPAEGGYRLRTSDGDIAAANVVVAVGSWQTPKIPAAAQGIAPHIVQQHASEYRNPDALPPGGVLVVGSGQSGCQIAEDLHRAGRDVVMAVSRGNKVPRRFRGRDAFWWLEQMGFLDHTVADLESPAARFTPNPHTTGRDGGYDLGLHELARDGVRLVGRVERCEGTRMRFATNLDELLAKYDAFQDELLAAFTKVADELGVPPDEHEADPPLRDAHDAEPIAELDLDEAGIVAVVWATGFAFDYSWIDLPIFDDVGYPVTTRGVTAFDGLYFVGLNWQYNRKSPILYGVGDDAKYVVEAIEGRATA